MPSAEQTLVQYLSEARASERALTQTLRAHIAAAPRANHRRNLEANLRRSEDHVERIDARLRELGHGHGLLTFGVRLFIGTAEWALALGAAPLRLARGSGEEQVLKNATEDCAQQARAIATHAALEDVARALEDPATAELAVTLRARHEKMLDGLMNELPRLADAAVNAEVYDKPTYEATRTGAADRVRPAGREVRDTAKRTRAGAKRNAERARKVGAVERELAHSGSSGSASAKTA